MCVLSCIVSGGGPEILLLSSVLAHDVSDPRALGIQNGDWMKSVSKDGGVNMLIRKLLCARLWKGKLSEQKEKER